MVDECWTARCVCLCVCVCVCPLHGPRPECLCSSGKWPLARHNYLHREPPLCRPGKTENTMPSPCCQSGCCGANKKQGSRLCSQSLTGSTGLHRCSPCSKTSASSKLYGLMFSNRTVVHCVTARIPDSSSPPSHDLGGTLCDWQKLAPHHAPSPSLSYAYPRSPYQRQ